MNHVVSGSALRLGEYVPVMLMVSVDREDVRLPSGARGVIVHDHEDGSYTVEFEKPSFDVVTVLASEMCPVA